MAFSSGTSALQSGHHDAQNTSTTFLPRKSLMLTGLPAISSKVNSGASAPGASRSVA